MPGAAKYWGRLHNPSHTSTSNTRNKLMTPQCLLQRSGQKESSRPSQSILKMDPVEAWARGILAKLDSWCFMDQMQLIQGPFESVRNGMLALLSVSPAYAGQAKEAAKLLGDVLTTVRHAFNSTWSTTTSGPVLLVPLPVTDYGVDTRLSMSDRITKRGPAFVLGVLQHSLDALGRSICILNLDGVADSGQVLHTIESASEDAIAVATFLHATSRGSSEKSETEGLGSYVGAGMA